MLAKNIKFLNVINIVFKKSTREQLFQHSIISIFKTIIIVKTYVS